MSKDTRKVGYVPSSVAVNSRVCGLWRLTADKMIKRQDQVKSQMIIPTGCPSPTPFTFLCFSIMDYSPLQGHGPHIFASTSLLLWFPFLKNPLDCRNAIISHSNINTFSFKWASLIFPPRIVSLTFLNLLSFIHSKNIFQVPTMTLELSHVLREHSIDSLEIV